jgi:hypothetical protein
MKIVITESQYRFLIENTVEIDQILDKLGEIGYENLENDEKMTLNRYSEWLNSGQKGEFMGEITPKNTNFEDISGQKWSKTLSDGSDFTFQFDYDEVDEDVELYFGTVYWAGKEWIGCIVAEKDGELGLLDFAEDTDLESYDIETEEDPSTTKYLTDSLGDLNDEVDFFIEEEIIPELMNK